MAQTLSEIKACLAAFGLRPKRRFGQNFLHDGNQMARVLEAASLRRGDLVLEVGAGTGALSQRLLEAGARLVAVEVDRDLEPVLQRQLSDAGARVTVVIADVLAGKHVINPVVGSALESAFTKERSDRVAATALTPFKLVANLPYNIACPLLANLLTTSIGSLRMDCAVVMVQREVADRLCARSGSRDYGALSVLVQAMASVRRIGTVPPSCFWPSPKVDSAIIQLQRHAHPLTDNPAALVRTLRQLFATRRKQLGTILGRHTLLPDGIDPRGRPEQMTVEQIVALSDWMCAGHRLG